MAKRLRYWPPTTIFLITNRCVDEKLLLRPSPEVNALILACLTRAAERSGIELMGFIFMGNHFHLLVRVPRTNLGDFMRNFESWLVIKLKNLVPEIGKIKGSLFPVRYREVHIIDESKALEKLTYILTNPCAADLVKRPGDYPGLSSLSFHESEAVIKGRWVNEEKFNKNRKRNPNYAEEKAVTYHCINLTPLPGMEGLTKERRWEVIRNTVEKRCEKLDARRGRKPVLGARKVLCAKPTSRPKQPEFSSYTDVVGADSEQVRAYREQRRDAVASFYKARRRDRDEKRKTAVRYPCGMCRPGEARGRKFTRTQTEKLLKRLESTITLPPLKGLTKEGFEVEISEAC